MKVIEFLNKNSVQKLMDVYHIKVREYPEDGIMVLNYDMIESPKYEPIVRECRSLILENKRPYRVISRSFYRFFNHGECRDTDKMNFKNAVVWEKVDGSIINVYWHNDKWNVSTRSMANAEGETVSGYTFREIIDNVIHISSFNALGMKARDYTFVLELVSPKSRVVKPYPEDDVYLLAAINKLDGSELGYNDLFDIGSILSIKLPTVAPVTSYDAVKNVIGDLDTFDEGFVIADYTDLNHIHRIKMKNPSYLAIAHLRENGTISPKRISLLVWENDYDEYLSYFPEDKQFFIPYIEAFGKLLQTRDDLWDKVKHIENQKEFAMAVNGTPVSNILFQMKKGMTMDQISTHMFDKTKHALLEKFKD